MEGRGEHTLAISAPNTGETPVMVPTAKPTNMRPIITESVRELQSTVYGHSRIAT